MDVGPFERLITECACQTMSLTVTDQQDKLIFKFFADRRTDSKSCYGSDLYSSGLIKKENTAAVVMKCLSIIGKFVTQQNLVKLCIQTFEYTCININKTLFT